MTPLKSQLTMFVYVCCPPILAKAGRKMTAQNETFCVIVSKDIWEMGDYERFC